MVSEFGNTAKRRLGTALRGLSTSRDSDNNISAVDLFDKLKEHDVSVAVNGDRRLCCVTVCDCARVRDWQIRLTRDEHDEIKEVYGTRAGGSEVCYSDLLTWVCDGGSGGNDTGGESGGTSGGVGGRATGVRGGASSSASSGVTFDIRDALLKTLRDKMKAGVCVAWWRVHVLVDPTMIMHVVLWMRWC